MNNSVLNERDWDALTGGTSQPASAPTAPGTALVPFGKYRGQPVEAMAADRGYCDWLTAQPWFRDQHPRIYSIVINNFAEPNETPEHNQMQVRFLDAEWRRKFVYTVYPGDNLTAEGLLGRVARPDPERWCLVDDGGGGFEIWGFSDGVRGIPGWWQQHKGSERCRADGCLGYYDACIPPQTSVECEVGSPDFECDGVDVRFCAYRESPLDTPINGGGVAFGHTLHVEIKPQLGDEFPAVLRQIKRLQTEETTVRKTDCYGHFYSERVKRSKGGCWPLLVRRFHASVSLPQVRAFFRHEYIALVLEEEVEATKLPGVTTVAARDIAERTGLSVRQRETLRGYDAYCADYRSLR